MAKEAASCWMDATLQNIRDDRWYLVQTNGMEWRDHDLMVMKGIAVSLRLKPEITRGRPTRVALINQDDEHKQ